MKGKRKGGGRRPLGEEVARARPDVADPATAIREGRVLVEGRIVANPRSLVDRGVSIVVIARKNLRGEAKLEAALGAFDVAVRGRVALDVGAAAGGFTKALLRAGARRVYAVEAGHGQLLGSLRGDARVASLERTNLGELNRTLVPEPVDVITLDLSYLPVARAVGQLERVDIAPGADLLALVKPMFELGMASLPTERFLPEAVRRARTGIGRGPWKVGGWMESPFRGARGAVEFFVHARRWVRGRA
jgi:23S rRNA (cytidine1920-2'-O)/16S rRNA (cytidine1409-2'-O)-methyltransferase